MHTILVQAQPFVTLTFHVALALAALLLSPYVPQIASAVARFVHLQNNSIARATIAQILYDGLHYVNGVADDAATHVGTIDVGDPRLAALVNFAKAHSADELRHLGVTDEKLIAMAQIAAKQFPDAVASSPTKTKET